jgi:DNA-directed RNA polymerase subunit N (RpoN/RPB10)
MADTQQTKSNRDRLLERMKGKYPDKSFDDDEALSGQINDDYDDYDRRISEGQDREKAFSELFTNNPKAGRLMMDWKDGVDPAVNLVRLYGTDIKDEIDDPEKQEEIAAANKEYMERVAKEKGYEEEYQKNLAELPSVLDAAQKKFNASDDEIDKAMELIMQQAKSAMLGKFEESTIESALKSIRHDGDVEQAQQEAEIRGRNANIEAKIRRSKKGDGTNPFSSSGLPASSSPSQNLGALDRMSTDDDIYARGGGFKRTKHS